VLRLTGPAGTFDLPATFKGELGHVVVETAAIADTGALPRGRYEMTGHLGGPAAPALAVGTVAVRDDGKLLLVGLRGANRLARLDAWARWSVHEAADAVRTRAIDAARQLPSPAKDVLRVVHARLRP
jgi:hypothetical protein